MVPAGAQRLIQHGFKVHSALCTQWRFTDKELVLSIGKMRLTCVYYYFSALIVLLTFLLSLSLLSAHSVDIKSGVKIVCTEKMVYNLFLWILFGYVNADESLTN